jgi:hypothetical protein
VIGELLQAGEKGGAVYARWKGLKNPDGGMFLHRRYHSEKGGAAHDAVGVQNDHVPVFESPPAAKVGDIAALALHVDPAVSVENAVSPVHQAGKSVPGGFFLDPCVRIG